MPEFLKKEDYEEPRCLLNMHPEVVRIPTGRVLVKLDSYLSKNDYEAAERHLQYWIKEAEAGNDIRGKLTVLNEQIGLYRKMGQKEGCLKAIENALTIANTMDLEDSITYATTLINAATGYKAFEQTNQALPLYQKAKVIYETNLNPNDERLGGLYNNMALALTELKEYNEAKQLFHQAMDVMKNQEHGELEIAITYLNLADLVVAESGFEDGYKEIDEYVHKAEDLLNTKSIPRDGYYAFVCEKCAPVFGYYGHFLTEEDLNQRARDIYERT